MSFLRAKHVLVFCGATSLSWYAAAQENQITWDPIESPPTLEERLTAWAVWMAIVVCCCVVYRLIRGSRLNADTTLRLLGTPEETLTGFIASANPTVHFEQIRSRTWLTVVALLVSFILAGLCFSAAYVEFQRMMSN